MCTLLPCVFSLQFIKQYYKLKKKNQLRTSLIWCEGERGSGKTILSLNLINPLFSLKWLFLFLEKAESPECEAIFNYTGTNLLQQNTYIIEHNHLFLNKFVPKYAVGMHLQEGCLLCVSICRNQNQFSAFKKRGKFEWILKMSRKSNIT